MLSVPKWLRYFMRRDGAALNMVLRTSPRVIAQSRPTHITEAAQVDKAALHIGAVALAKPQVHIHRHRYFGVLAPNSPLRAAAVALTTSAQPAKQVVVQTDPATTGEGAPGMAPLGHASPPAPEPATPTRSKAHYLWAVLIASCLRPCGADRSDAQRTSSDPN